MSPDLILRNVCVARLGNRVVLPLSEDGGGRFGFLVDGDWLYCSGARLMQYHEWRYLEGEDLTGVEHHFGRTGHELLVLMATPEGRYEIANMPLLRPASP
jgi:hypothetical protein